MLWGSSPSKTKLLPPRFPEISNKFYQAERLDAQLAKIATLKERTDEEHRVMLLKDFEAMLGEPLQCLEFLEMNGLGYTWRDDYETVVSLWPPKEKDIVRDRALLHLSQVRKDAATKAEREAIAVQAYFVFFIFQSNPQRVSRKAEAVRLEKSGRRKEALVRPPGFAAPSLLLYNF